MIGECVCLRRCMCSWVCRCAWSLRAHTLMSLCLSMAGNLSAFLSISGLRAQWDINYNMQQSHLCKSHWKGGITFLIKSPWLIVIKVSSVNVSSWLSNSRLETVSTSQVMEVGGGGGAKMEGRVGEVGRKVCVIGATDWDTNSSWAHWQPSYNWQLWNTIISVICLRIHQRLQRPVKTFREREREREGVETLKGEEASLIKWDFYFVQQIVHIMFHCCEKINFSVVFLSRDQVFHPIIIIWPPAKPEHLKKCDHYDAEYEFVWVCASSESILFLKHTHFQALKSVLLYVLEPWNEVCRPLRMQMFVFFT